MTTVKTNNSYLADKVALRLAHLPDKKVVKVLDCFAGRGVIWQAVRKLAPGRDIRVLPIEVKPQEEDVLFYLPGDNTRFLETLDLGRFDVIDLDAYGVPYDQLSTIFRRGFMGVVYVTFIQASFGIMSNGLLQEIGFSRQMINKSPVLFTKRGWQYFLEYLAKRGVRTVWIRQHQNKHYLCFSCAAAPAADSDNQKEGTFASRS